MFPFRSALRAIGSLRKASSTTWYWFGIYIVSALIVLMVAIWVGIQLLPTLRDFALDYIFPDTWHPFVNELINRLFSEQMVNIITSAGMTLGVMVVGLCLFPIKEKLSASFESDAFPELEKGRELPLYKQGIDELKLLGIYSVLFSVSLFLGLQGNTTLSLIGSLIGYWYLVLAMALDHTAPIFQRRGTRLLGITYLVFRRIPLSLHFVGAVFVLPAVLVPYLLAGSLDPIPRIALVVIAEVIGMALATLAGCTLGAEIIEKGLHKSKPPKVWTWGVMSVMTVIIIWQGIYFTSWGIAAHQHSQLLKCTYDVDWKNADFDFHGRAERDERVAIVDLSAPLSITNETGHDLAIRHASVEIKHLDRVLGRVELPTFSAPTGETTTVIAEMQIEIPMGNLLERLKSMINRDVLNQLSVYLILDPPLSPPMRIPIRRSSS